MDFSIFVEHNLQKGNLTTLSFLKGRGTLVEIIKDKNRNDINKLYEESQHKTKYKQLSSVFHGKLGHKSIASKNPNFYILNKKVHNTNSCKNDGAKGFVFGMKI